MKKQLTGLLMTIATVAFGQDADTLRTQVLSTIVVKGLKLEHDTLQNFYRANPSGSTENILTRLSGASLIRRGAFGQEPVLRGLSNGQINVTLDGMKIFGACTDRMDPVTIYVEPNNLSIMQAITGNGSSEFGSTFGGSLNMKLAEPDPARKGVHGQSGFDFLWPAKAVTMFSALNIGRSKSAYRGSLTYRKSDNYYSGAGTEVPYSQFEKVNLSTSGKWATGKFDTLQAHVLFDQGWNLGFPALPMDVAEARAGIFSLTFQRVAPWIFFHNVRIKGYHNRISHVMDDANRDGVLMHMNMPGKSSTTGIYVEGDVHLFHQHRTFMKAEYFTNNLVGEMTMASSEGSPMYMQTAPDATRQNIAYYVNQEFRLNKNRLSFFLRADLFHDDLHKGMGMDQLKVIHSKVAGSSLNLVQATGLTIERKLSYRTKLDLQVGFAERIPTLNERFGYYLFNRFDGYDYVGNPNLKNENSWTAEVTFRYFGSSMEWHITPYWKNISEYIFGYVEHDIRPMTPGANGVKRNENISRAQISGFDITLLARPVRSVSTLTTVKYTRGTNSLDEFMPLMPPLKINSSWRYEHRQFNIQADTEWSAAQKQVSTSFGEAATPAYWILSLRTGYKPDAHWQLTTGIENVMNSLYREHLDWGGLPRPGRSIYINLIHKF